MVLRYLRGGLTSKTDSQLKGEVSRFESWGTLGGAAVIVGLLAEVALAWSFPHGDTFAERWGNVIADKATALERSRCATTNTHAVILTMPRGDERAYA
jgi:hypothetical protein